jgi:hypothetical protein
MASKNYQSSEVHEMHELLATAELRNMSNDIEKATWLVHNGVSIDVVSDYFGLQPHLFKMGKTSSDHPHVGRPRLLHEDSEALLHQRIDQAALSGKPLTRAECLEIVRKFLMLTDRFFGHKG